MIKHFIFIFIVGTVAQAREVKQSDFWNRFDERKEELREKSAKWSEAEKHEAQMKFVELLPREEPGLGLFERCFFYRHDFRGQPTSKNHEIWYSCEKSMWGDDPSTLAKEWLKEVQSLKP